MVIDQQIIITITIENQTKIIIIKIIKLLNEIYSYLALENLLISAAICKLIPNPKNPILLNIILINLLLSGIMNFIIKYYFFYL